MMRLKIKIKRISSTAILPTKAHPTDACFDIYADIPVSVCIDPNKTVSIHTGFTTEIPQGYYAAVYARSGLGIKKGIRLANDVGIIDADYRGEWMVALHNDSETFYWVSPGDRIAQFSIHEVIPCELEEVEELTNTDRGEGGFGSSGK